MKKVLYKLLDIRAGELRPVLLLLAWSFFLGIFIVSYDIGSNTLFIDAYGQAELPRLFVLSGALGVVFTYLFVTLQKKVSFASLTKYAFIGLLIVCATIGIALELTKVDFLKYLSFALLGPINAIALLCFYGVISRAFDVRNEKRLTGTVDQGQMFATSIAFFAVYLLPDTMDIVYYIFIGTGALCVSLFCYLVFIKKYETDLLVTIPYRQEQENVSATSMVSIFQNKYTRLIILLFLCSIIALQFVEYSFLSVTYDKYNTNNVFDDKGYAGFLAAFGGVMTIFMLLFDLFGADRVIQTVGVRTSLLILPSLLFLFATLSSLIGTYFGYSTESETFNIFFIFICLGKLFLQSCIDSFEDPIMKNFFLPISSKVRHDIQAKIEGVFRQLSYTTAGVLLLVFGLLSFELPHYNIALAVVFAIYFYVVWRLYAVYRNTLQETLTAQKRDAFSSFGDYSVVNILRKELETALPDRTINTLKLIERIEPSILENSTINLVKDHSPLVRKHALEKIDHLKSFHAAELIRNAVGLENNSEIKSLGEQALSNLNNAEKLSKSEDTVYSLSRSPNINDRILAARILARCFNEKTASILIDLLRDTHPMVRKAALGTAGKVEHSQSWFILIDHLSSALFSNFAAAGLYEIGEKIIPTLDLTFYKTGQDHRMMLKIIQIFGRIRGERAIESLWSKIDYPDKQITSEVLLSLSICGFNAKGERATKITRILEKEISIASWKLAALIEIEEQEDGYLYQALQEEINHNRYNVFLLLSLLYDASSIRLVKENIESDTVEGVLYAMELLDVFVADELKPILFPFLDQLSVHEKVEKLQEQIPRPSYNSVEVLKKIINKDYNEINRWTKACAIFKFTVIPEKKLYDDVVAHLYNPDPLLRQIAAWTVYSIDQEAFRKHMVRLPFAYQNEFEAVVLNNTLDIDGYENNMHFEKVLYLKDLNFFKHIPGVSQAAIVDHFHDEWLKEGEVLIHEGEEGNTPIYILIHGSLTCTNQAGERFELGKKSIIGNDLILETDLNPYTITASTDSLLYKLEKDTFFEIISGYYQMAEAIIPQINNIE